MAPSGKPWRLPQSLLQSSFCISCHALLCVLIHWSKLTVVAIDTHPTTATHLWNTRHSTTWPSTRKSAHGRWWWINPFAYFSFLSLLSSVHLLSTTSCHRQNTNEKPWVKQKWWVKLWLHPPRLCPVSALQPHFTTPDTCLPWDSAPAVPTACDTPSPAWLSPSFLLCVFDNVTSSGNPSQWRVAPVATLSKTLPSTHFKTPASLFLAHIISPSLIVFCVYPALECKLHECRIYVWCVYCSISSAHIRARHLVGILGKEFIPRSIFSPSLPCSEPREVGSYGCIHR